MLRLPCRFHETRLPDFRVLILERKRSSTLSWLTTIDLEKVIGILAFNHI